MALDFLAGLDVSRERCLVEPPPDTPMYAENFMLSAYDPAADVGMWLHLGTWPEDFGLWEDFLVVNLPDDVLWMSAYHRTEPERRPAGSNLAFRCVEPFRRWRVTFDGVVSRSRREEQLEGRLRNGRQEPMTFELEAECVTPILG